MIGRESRQRRKIVPRGLRAGTDNKQRFYTGRQNLSLCTLDVTNSAMPLSALERARRAATNSFKSIVGLFLALAGAVAFAIGGFFIVASIVLAVTEGWGGHASGLSLVVYGLLLVLPGALVARRGLRIYRSTLETVRAASSSTKSLSHWASR